MPPFTNAVMSIGIIGHDASFAIGVAGNSPDTVTNAPRGNAINRLLNVRYRHKADMLRAHVRYPG